MCVHGYSYIHVCAVPLCVCEGGGGGGAHMHTCACVSGHACMYVDQCDRLAPVKNEMIKLKDRVNRVTANSADNKFDSS